MSDEPVKPAGVPSHPDEWSDASKRSVSYCLHPASYQDIDYVCCRCCRPDVFTAEEQKHAFEVRKAYVWQRRVLCRSCHRERVELEREVRECRRRWAEDRQALRCDAGFLRRWLTVLEALPGYGGEADRANVVMLRRLIDGSN